MRASEADGRVGRGDRVFHGLVAGLLAGVLAASLLGVDRWRWGREPDAAGAGLTPCLLRRMTGLPCLACGMTRSFCSLGRGEWGSAWTEHPLGPPLAVLLVLALVRSAGVALVGRTWLDGAARGLVHAVPVLVVAAVVAWLARLAWMAADGSASAAWHASPLGRMLAAGG